MQALRLLGDFGLFVSDGRVSLTMIFMALMAENETQEAKERYKELGRLVKENNPSIPVSELLAA
jgi:hypothetical protein